MQQRSRRSLRQFIARLILVAMIAGAMPLQVLLLPAIAEAAAPESRIDPTPSWLPDLLVFGPFPSGYPTHGPEGAEPAVISGLQPTADLTLPVPSQWQPPTYETAEVTFTVSPFEAPGGPKPIHTDSYALTQPLLYTWNGGGERDGLYTWSAVLLPIKPECPPAEPDPANPDPPAPAECLPEFDPTEQVSGPYPVIIDRTAPEILGLRMIRDNWIGVEVKDASSGVAAVEVALFPAGSSPSSSPFRTELANHPRHALVRLNLADLASADLIARITVTDFAGNQSTETLPLYPVARMPQLGTGGPWPGAEAIIGGLPQAVSLVSGNGFLQHTEFSLPAHSLSLNVTRSYNHQVREKGLLGWGWQLSLEQNLRTIGSVVIWRDASGTEYWWDRSSGEQRPLVDGIRREWPKLGWEPDGYTVFFPDASNIRFGPDGKVEALRDHRYQQRVSYHWQDDRLASVTTSAGQRVDLAYLESGLLQRLTLKGADGAQAGQISFAYQNENLTRVDGLYGRTILYEYDDYHRMTSITLPAVDETPTAAITWHYGARNRLTDIQMDRSDANPLDPLEGQQEFLAVDYQDQTALQAWIADPAGVSRLYWDELGRPARTERQLDAEGQRWRVDQFTFTGHNLKRHTDPLGQMTDYAYDARQNVTEVLLPDRVSRTTYQYAYGLLGIIEQVTATDWAPVNGTAAQVSTHTTDYSEGRPVRIAISGGGAADQMTRYTYGDDGLLRSVTNPYGYVTRYDYDSRGMLTRITDWPGQPGEGALQAPGAEWTEYTHDGLGRPLTVTTRAEGADVIKDEYAYSDTYGSVTITHRQPAGARTLEAGKPMASGTLAQDTRTEIRYLQSYRPGSRPLSVIRSYVGAPPAGQPASVTTTYRYNNAGMMEQTTSGDETAAYRYDAVGHLITAAVRESVTRYTYDPGGRLSRIDSPTGGYVTYTYDLAGQLKQETAAFLQGAEEIPVAQASYQYDKLGRHTVTESPVSGKQTTSYGFTAQGAVVTVTLEQPKPYSDSGELESISTEVKYDRLGRIVSQRTADDLITYTYQTSQPVITAAFARIGADGAQIEEQALTYRLDGRGRTAATNLGIGDDPALTVTYSYDGFDRVIRSSEPLDGSGAARGEVRLSYDAQGRVYRAQADDQTYRYSYNLTGAPVGEQAWTGAALTRSSAYAYNADHRLTALTRSSGAESSTLTFTYENGHLASIAGAKGAYSGTMFTLSTSELGLPTGVTRAGEFGSQMAQNPFGQTTGMITPAGSLYQLDWENVLAKVEAADPRESGATASGGQPPAGLVFTQTPKSGQLFTQRFPDGSVAQQVYDGFGRLVAQSDNTGKVTEYEYYPNGRLKAVKEPLGRTRTFTWDAAGRLAAETDSLGHTTEYRYEENGLRIIKTERLDDGTVIETAVQRTVRGKPLWLRDGEGNITRFEYDALGRLTKIDAPRDGISRAVTQFKYDAVGNLTQVTDPRGIATQYTRNEQGQISAIVRGSGLPETYTYNQWGKVTATTDRSGQTTSYSYNPAGRLTQVTYPLEPGESTPKSTAYVWDQQGRLARMIDPDGHETRYDYHPRGWLEQVTESGTLGSHYRYDEMGRLTYQRDAEGRTISYEYDLLGRLAWERFGDGLWRRYQYDANGNLIAKSDPAVTTTYAYDSLGRVTAMQATDGNWAAFTYDRAGNKLTQSGPEGTWSFTYWPDGRIKTSLDPNGQTDTFIYDAAGNQLSGGGQTGAEYDQYNRVKEVTIGGHTYRYEYDARGNVTEIYLPNGLVTHIRYDHRNRITRQWTDGSGQTVTTGQYTYEGRDFRTGALEDGRAFTYAYDGRNQMAQVTNWRGDVIRYTYDGAGNLTQRAAVISGASVDLGETISVDELMVAILLALKGKEEAEEKEPAKKLGALETGPQLASLAADFGLVASKGGNAGGNSNAGGNGNGNAGGNAGGNGNANGNAGGNGNKPEAPPGQLRKEALQESLKTPGAQACLNALTRGQGAKVGLLRKCGEDLGLKKLTGLEANLLSIIDNLVNGEYYLPPGDKEELYQVVRDVAQGFTIVGMTYRYNGLNQLTSRHNLVRDELHTYAYDNRGNMLDNGRSQFSYDSENRLIGVRFPDNEGMRFAYDSMGRRISKTSFNAQEKGEHTTYFEYEGNSWRVARERNKDGAITAEYTYDLNSRPLTITTGGATYWYLYNAHGDVVALADAGGTVKARYEYDEWGRLEAMYDENGRVREGYGTIGEIGTGPARPVIGSPTPGTSGGNGNGNGKGGAQKGGSPEAATLSEPAPDLTAEVTEDGELMIQGVIGQPTDLVKLNPYRYGGYRYDRETQYYYLRARYYDGRLARFLSLDTVAGETKTPLSLNRYIYSINNPVNHLDPTGRSIGVEVVSAEGGGGGGCANGTRYKTFMSPPPGPSDTRRPNDDETLFIQWLYGICNEVGYASQTRQAISALQATNGIPVDDQVMIGPRTWALLLERYNRRIERLELLAPPVTHSSGGGQAASAGQGAVPKDSGSLLPYLGAVGGIAGSNALKLNPAPSNPAPVRPTFTVIQGGKGAAAAKVVKIGLGLKLVVIGTVTVIVVGATPGTAGETPQELEEWVQGEIARIPTLMQQGQPYTLPPYDPGYFDPLWVQFIQAVQAGDSELAAALSALIIARAQEVGSLFPGPGDVVVEGISSPYPITFYSYKELHAMIRAAGLSGKRKGLEAHHLLAKVWADKFGVIGDDIIAVPLTPLWHRGQNGVAVIGSGTNIMNLIERDLVRITGLPYMQARDLATPDQIWQAHRNTYEMLGHEDWARAIYELYVKPLGIPYR